jgi:hypothetical protein
MHALSMFIQSRDDTGSRIHFVNNDHTLFH